MSIPLAAAPALVAGPQNLAISYYRRLTVGSLYFFFFLTNRTGKRRVENFGHIKFASQNTLFCSMYIYTRRACYGKALARALQL